MTVIEIINQAILHKQMTISIPYGKKWINEAKHQLALEFDTACKRGDTPTEITCSDVNAKYPLPAGALRVKEVYDSDGEEYKDFDTDMGYIRFDDEGTYQVICLFETKDVTGDNETPKIHPAYHMAISKYVAAMELEDLKPAKAQKKLQDFWAEAKSVDIKLRRGKRKPGVLPAPLFR